MGAGEDGVASRIGPDGGGVASRVGKSGGGGQGVGGGARWGEERAG